MRFCDIDLTLYARTGLSRKRRSEGGTSLPDMMEPTMWVKKYIATLATDENARMGREALQRVETQWWRPFQRVKEGINNLIATNKKVAETEAFAEDLTKGFIVDLMRLG